MKHFCLAILAFGLVTFYSCSSPVYTQVADDADLTSYNTYMLVKTHASSDSLEKPSRTTAFADIPMRNAVNAELKKLGWKQVESEPDILVSYDILVERDVVRESEPVYTQPFTRWYYNPYTRRWASIYYPSQFLGYDSYDVPVEDVTISITLLDSESDAAVWQGWTTEKVNGSELRSDEISRNVRNIFRKLDL